MQPMAFALTQFDLDGFLAAHIAFTRQLTGGEVPLTRLIATVEKDDSISFGGAYARPAELRKAMVNGATLFLDFHERYLEDPFECIDGQTITVPEEFDDDGNTHPDWDDRYYDIPRESAHYGYVVTINNGQVHIAAGLFADGCCMTPAPTVTLVNDNRFFDTPMREFCERFVKTGVGGTQPDDKGQVGDDRIGPAAIKVCTGCRHLAPVDKGNGAEYRCGEAATGRMRAIATGSGPLLVPMPDWCPALAETRRAG